MALVTCKECGQQISSQVHACPQCGARQPYPKTVKIGLCLLVLSGAASVLIVLSRDHRNGDAASSESQHSPREAMEVLSEKFVKAALKSPATADFAPDDEWTIVPINKSVAKLNGWVDSQNSFGALVRTYFTVAIDISGESSRLVYLKFDEDKKPVFGSEPLTAAEQSARAKETADTIKRSAEDAALHGDYDARTKAIDDANRAIPHARLGPARSLEAAHLGPLWAEHLKEEKAKADAEREAREEAELDEKKAAEKAAAKAAEEALYHNFTKADSTPYGECKPKSYEQGIYTLVDRDGEEHKIAKESLSAADQLFLETWIKGIKPEAVPRRPDPPKKASRKGFTRVPTQ